MLLSPTIRLGATVLVSKEEVRAVYLLFRPFLSNGVKIDFVYLIATMPGRHSGDQVHKVDVHPIAQKGAEG